MSAADVLSRVRTCTVSLLCVLVYVCVVFVPALHVDINGVGLLAFRELSWWSPAWSRSSSCIYASLAAYSLSNLFSCWPHTCEVRRKRRLCLCVWFFSSLYCDEYKKWDFSVAICRCIVRVFCCSSKWIVLKCLSQLGIHSPRSAL